MIKGSKLKKLKERREGEWGHGAMVGTGRQLGGSEVPTLVSTRALDPSQVGKQGGRSGLFVFTTRLTTLWRLNLGRKAAPADAAAGGAGSDNRIGLPPGSPIAVNPPSVRSTSGQGAVTVR